eukprot:TRINITY_DN25952_c0_g3_i1.p1 TRINITY_DN25952_c0_g3~~TRINITY_DN25952_c0_g3_i1.p1  ORF type:complete len:268 (+),score=62.30 TRINITY_DN25952_c0_g3_i1:44-805(+)
MAPRRQSRVRRKRWCQLVKPGRPLQVKGDAAAALRLGLASMAGEGTEGGPLEVELRVQLPKASFPGPLALVRLGGGGLRSSKLRALVACTEGAELSAEGGAIWVSGRLETALPADGAQTGSGGAHGAGLSSAKDAKATTAAPAAAAPAAPAAASAASSGAKAAAKASRPRNEEEYLDLLEAYIRTNGRVSLRKLGNDVAKPPGVEKRTLKERLLKQRHRFLVDLQNQVELNRARRWRWRNQPAVARARVIPER